MRKKDVFSGSYHLYIKGRDKEKWLKWICVRISYDNTHFLCFKQFLPKFSLHYRMILLRMILISTWEMSWGPQLKNAEQRRITLGQHFISVMCLYEKLYEWTEDFVRSGESCQVLTLAEMMMILVIDDDAHNWNYTNAGILLDWKPI